MRARLVRPDGTTEPVDLPEDPAAARAAVLAVLDCRTVTVTRVLQPGTGSPGLDMWTDGHSLITGLPANPAAEAVVAFLTRGQLRLIFAGAAVFTGGPGTRGDTTALAGEHEETIATISTAIRGALADQPGQPGGDGGPA
jgi:hypothetical protein